MAAINAQRQKAAVWEREVLKEPGQEEQSEPAPAPKGSGHLGAGLLGV